MLVSGETIRQTALEREQNCKPGMNSFYYGFREGAKWMQGIHEGNKKEDLGLSLMVYLDKHRPEEKMGLSNMECAQIDKAVRERDWETIIKYIDKYR